MQCDISFQSSILFWALSALIPNSIFHYLGLGAAAASPVIYAAHHKRPSVRLSRLNATITAVTEILMRAKSRYARAHFDLVAAEGRLLQAELGASKVQTRLLQAEACGNLDSDSDETWAWITYIQSMHEIWQSLDEFEREVRATKKAILVGGYLYVVPIINTLQLIIEAERQRKLRENINEQREIVCTAMLAQGRTSSYAGLNHPGELCRDSNVDALKVWEFEMPPIEAAIKCRRE
ncbi:hypothetical protein C8J57DRAFT_1517180 [Mycena rebaudengoi]|nr:hypothetical protein C8J57DRAFT_1517180 [Mycena rebaudengoi]